MTQDSETRMAGGLAIAREAAQLALDFFRRREELLVQSKGPQDMVSEADQSVERFVRAELGKRFSQDAIHGEEYGRTAGSSGFAWVIDPIDGTANFVAGIPSWCVVLACVKDGTVVAGIIVDPNSREEFTALKGQGAWLNGKPMRVSASQSIREGSLGMGYCNRIEPTTLFEFLVPYLEAGGMFYRNASGALMLAYVAAGRLIGYHEGHMNPWDCLAGLLMIEEAGGRCWPYNTDKMMAQGDAILGSGPGIFDAIDQMAGFTRSRPPRFPT
jgi:myo-inositol-1(or 4)-monophosphatase